MKRDLCILLNLSPKEIEGMLVLSKKLKEKDLKGESYKPLSGKSLALIFEKPSMRTRVSCELGMRQLGGEAIYIGPQEAGIGKRESIKDYGRVLSGYFDGILARTYSHDNLLKLAASASVPVINGLSDLFHPCQVLSDFFTLKERFGKLQGLKVAFIGDGNNVCHSLILGSPMVGIELRVASPKGYEPKEEVVNGREVIITADPREAAQDVDAIYTDTWVSMGQEEEAERRREIFRPYQVNAELVGLAKKEAVVMHCLPAHRGEEITDEVIDGEHSIVFDQAQNRLYTQKAIFVFFLS